MVQSLGQEDPLEEEMAIHSSILAWEIPWTEEPEGLLSMRLKESCTTEYMTEHAHTLNSIYVSGCFNCDFLDLLCLFGIRSSQGQTINQVLTTLLSGQTGCSKAGPPTPSYPVLTHQTITPPSSLNQGQVLGN